MLLSRFSNAVAKAIEPSFQICQCYYDLKTWQCLVSKGTALFEVKSCKGQVQQRLGGPPAGFATCDSPSQVGKRVVISRHQKVEDALKAIGMTLSQLECFIMLTFLGPCNYRVKTPYVPLP